ncbi:phage tail tape measure protein [Xanthobacter sp. 126]|uniref:phage tail tape measure protein n=1 Tax=Xanthobacter sp. 126 TaxID=1131814 RepID=UPI0018CC3463|nr:phage tail tape measure protein [Xanthobacter sp. 126]
MLRGPAQQAKGDLKSVGEAARRLNGTRGGEKLEKDLNRVSGAARKATGDVQKLDRASRALGTGGRIGSPGGGAAAARIGAFAAGSGEVGSALGVPGMALGAGVAAGGAIAGGAIAAGLALKASVREAIKFEDAMAEVRKAVDLDPKGLAEIERTILKLSRTTPLAKEEIAQLVAQAGFAGRPTEDLVRFATFAAKAAVAFGMTAEDAGDSLAKLGNVFHLTQDGIEQLGDAINTLGDNTASKEREIVDFLKRVGANAKTFGLAERQTAAFGAAIISLGVAPEVASTGFTSLITKMSTAEKGEKKFHAGLKALGLNAKQVTKMIKDGPATAVLEVLKRIDKLAPDKKAGVLVDLFGLQYQDDVGRMAGALPEFIKALELVQDKSKTAGSVDKAFSIFDELTSSKIKKMEHQFASLGTRIGKAITPALGDAADAIASFLEKINTALDRTAEAKELADKLASGQSLTAEERGRLKGDPELNKKFQGDVAAKDHPLIGLLHQQIELEKELAAAQAAGAGGDLGAQNKAIALQAALAQTKAEVEEAMKLPGAADAVSQSMRAVTEAVSTEGEAAVQRAQEIADRIKALFNFTASPTISPQFAPSGDTSKMPSAPLPPSRPKMGAAAADGRGYAQTNTFHITGSDPEATAAAVHRQLARLGNSSNALFDTA